MDRRVAIIGTVGLPAIYGGFETLVEYLTEHLHSAYDLTVYCSGKSYKARLDQYNGAKLVYFPLKANGIQSIPYDILCIVNALRHSDTLLILGVSGCIVLPLVKYFTEIKVIVNIDGLEWKRAKWNKYAKRILKYFEKIAVRCADVIVTDNKVIQEYVKAEYGKGSVLIAYGADHVESLALSQELAKTYKFIRQGYAFTVCRIEPENNLHLILESMAKHEKLQMVIVGNWDASQYGEDLRSEYADYKHVHLLDPIYDQNILNQLRSNCLFYLHGHSAGGTNPSLVEAMFLGLPVFAYAADYNKETTEHQAYYFSDVSELSELVNVVKTSSLMAAGERMSEIAQRRYRWDIVSKQYSELF